MSTARTPGRHRRTDPPAHESPAPAEDVQPSPWTRGITPAAGKVADEFTTRRWNGSRELHPLTGAEANAAAKAEPPLPFHYSSDGDDLGLEIHPGTRRNCPGCQPRHADLLAAIRHVLRRAS